MNIVSEVQKKREFKELPISVVKRALNSIDLDDSKEKVKEARRILRKYFGVFLTNKVVKPKDIFDYDSILKNHKSSMKRDYSEFYSKIKGVVGSDVSSIIDLGCGMNGFSYPYIGEAFSDINYKGIEASGQVVTVTNQFFENREHASCIWGDLFDLDFVSRVLDDSKKNRLVFLFQIVDALENLEENFSKKFLLILKKYSDFVVLSLPVESLSGKTKFAVRRKWMLDFLEEHFQIMDDITMFGERFIFLKC